MPPISMKSLSLARFKDGVRASIEASAESSTARQSAKYKAHVTSLTAAFRSNQASSVPVHLIVRIRRKSPFAASGFGFFEHGAIGYDGNVSKRRSVFWTGDRCSLTLAFGRSFDAVGRDVPAF
jgi:hypothetical protein